MLVEIVYVVLFLLDEIFFQKMKGFMPQTSYQLYESLQKTDLIYCILFFAV